MSKNQNSKSKFRATSTWKKFRKRLGDDRKLDEVTLSKLRSGWTLHHMDLNSSHYTNLTNENNFKCLNKKTHDFIHWGFEYYKRDPSFLDRLQSIWNEMTDINKTLN